MTSPAKSIERLLVANRGEIACRIIRSARALGIETVAVCSRADRLALHTTMADRVVDLGEDEPTLAYLDIDRLLDAARRAGADAVHPGYGFLAENPAFARAVNDAGMVFVGPSPESIEAMGDKIRAREAAAEAGLPLIPSADLCGDEERDRRAAEQLGLPVLVKAAAGGGGRGMRVVESSADLSAAVASARREAGAAFGDDRVYLEKYLPGPRHVEIQVFGDGRGRAIHLGERECSVQRRHQKIIEESPSPIVDAQMRARMGEAAVALAEAIHYSGAGTVEFVVDANLRFYFLEMNTRLQVEHPVTEMVTGTDLVEWQLRIAEGRDLPHAPTARGHAIECRVYAEDPAAGFLPTGGTVLAVDHPCGPGIRVDTSLYDGVEVPPTYDPLLAKVVAWAPTRELAIERMDAALAEFTVLGVRTNVAFLRDVLADERFRSGEFTTTDVDDRFADWRPPSGSEWAVAAAVAAYLVETRAGNAARGPGVARTRPAGPWETLGAWRLGSGRRS
ncbi:MAG: ATP-grasp domain-containing protein [Deltaproteobacteria bacterium]|nr:MAG: ATP-grasp domain-containing protein [Deltaproteobacteria bacterium]